MIACRNAERSELELILDWAAAEGWNPGLDDAPAFFAADPKGFFIAEDQGAPVAAISVVIHDDGFAFLGLYIVLPSHRGRGIGYRLWQFALRHAGGCTVGLDGVEAQQHNYAASGFAHAGATTRFSGTVPQAAQRGIRKADPGDIPKLIAAEAKASGAAKPAYLRAWFANTPNRTSLVSQSAGRFDGFCTLRQCRAGAKIGPLWADDKTTAKRLIHHAASLAGGEVTLDVPQSAAGLSDLCHGLGLTPGFRTARMYRGPFNAPQPEFFAVTSLELG